MTAAMHTPTLPHYLNEENVSLLEQHWAELPKEAYCESTPQGWKIHLTGKSNYFVQAGFRNDEKIAPEKLLSYAKTSDKKSLVERLLAILEHIKRA